MYGFGKFNKTAKGLISLTLLPTVLNTLQIPNPLFDLAGIMCGHFQIPFHTFFLSTMIGKAVNKVSIQVIFIVVAFSKHMMSAVLKFMTHIAP